MAKSNPATLLVDFDCLSYHYTAEGERSPDMVRYVLDQEPDLAGIFEVALDELYPDHPWSSPGDSQFRRVCGWLLHPDRFPEIHLAEDSVRLLRALEETRRRMSGAYRSGAYSVHFWPDVPATLGPWARHYRVVVFSRTRPVDDQLTVLGRAVPGLKIDTMFLPSHAEESILDAFVDRLRPDGIGCLLILTGRDYAIAAEAQRRGIRCVLVDREWVATPYYEPGYGLYVPGLLDLDPARELARPPSAPGP